MIRLKSGIKRVLISRRLGPERWRREWVLGLTRKRTMLSRARLRNAYQICADQHLPAGAIVECGVGYGGCIAAMAYAAGPHRHVWGFDSFEGMPPLGPEDEGDGAAWVGFQCSGPAGQEAAQDTLRRLGLRNVSLVQGWFEQTLPRNTDKIGPIAVLRLDNDWFRSTLFCLNQLYPQVVSGGIIIIDDYFAFTGCRKAVDHFRAHQGIKSPLKIIEADSEVNWIKP